MSKLIHERFINCDPHASITAAHHNGGYAARLHVGGDIANSKPGVDLAGNSNTRRIYGEIRGAVNADTISVQIGGIARFRTNESIAILNAAIGQGIHAADDTATGFSESSGSVGDGRGQILGYEIEGGVTYIVVDLDAA